MEFDNIEMNRVTATEIDQEREYLMNLNWKVQESLSRYQRKDTEETQQIVDVWSTNLNEAISQMEDLIEHYPFIAVDTEFPGFISRSLAHEHHWLGGDNGYPLVSDNVNTLKMIQLGLTFYNEKGETPSPHTTFQFNFQFDIKNDIFAP
eukprot:792187_1